MEVREEPRPRPREHHHHRRRPRPPQDEVAQEGDRMVRRPLVALQLLQQQEEEEEVLERKVTVRVRV